MNSKTVSASSQIISRSHFNFFLTGFILILGLAFSGVAKANDGRDQGLGPLKMTSVIIDYSNNTMEIAGTNLKGTGNPIVKMARTNPPGTFTASLSVISSSSNKVKVTLPSGLIPAQYLLKMSRSSNSNINSMDEFNISYGMGSGSVGPQGPKGDTGATGPTGPMGPQGPAGANGAPGTNGTNGVDGAVGPMGPQGPAGVAYTDANGVPAIKVGDQYQGGLVFYIESPDASGYGQHGLIAAKSDLSPSAPWANDNTVQTFAIRDGLYGGKVNTNLIASKVGISSNDAIGIVLNYRVLADGTPCTPPIMTPELPGNPNPYELCYDDWYLPSRQELNWMFLNRVAIGGIPPSTSTSPSIYWSSTEVEGDKVWASGLTSGRLNLIDKIDTSKLYRVRAIRAF